MAQAAAHRGGSLADGGTGHDSLNRRTINGSAAGAADSVSRAASIYLPAYGKTQENRKTPAPPVKAIAGVGPVDGQRTHPKNEFRSEPGSRNGKDRRDRRACSGLSIQPGEAHRIRRGVRE